MKNNRLMFIPLLILMFVVLSPVNYILASESSALEVANQWMHHGTKLKSFISTDHNGVYESTFSFRYWTSGDYNYVSVLRSSDNYNFQQTTIGSSGVDMAYFAIHRIGRLNNADIAYLYAYMWTGTEWIRGNEFSFYINDLSIFGEETVPVFPDPINPGEILYDGNLFINSPPYDGYDVSSNRIEIRYGYGVPRSVPYPGKADISGVGVAALSHSRTSSRYDSDSNMQYNYYKAIVQLEPGYNTITVELDYDGEVYVDSRTVYYHIGFVDEDGDGLDDRTGQPIFPDSPDLGDGVPIPPGEDATIFDYIKYLVDSVLYSMGQMVIMLKGFMSGLTQFTQILGQFFSFMPAQFSSIIFLGLIIAVILRVIGR